MTVHIGIRRQSEQLNRCLVLSFQDLPHAEFANGKAARSNLRESQASVLVRDLSFMGFENDRYFSSSVSFFQIRDSIRDLA